MDKKEEGEEEGDNSYAACSKNALMEVSEERNDIALQLNSF